MKIGVFVLHYKDDRLTNACLDFVRRDAYGGDQTDDVQITVIDNGSPVPFSCDFPDPTVLRLPWNHFLIEAFNQAILKRPADVYVCLANDTQPALGMVAGLVKALNDPSVGVVAPGTNDQGAGVLYVPFSNPFWPTLEANHVDNTCWAFRHDVIKRIGMPDCQGHSHRACWGSNQDFCYRVRRAGYRVLAVRSAYIWHAHTGGQDHGAFEAGRSWLRRKYGEERAVDVWKG